MSRPNGFALLTVLWLMLLLSALLADGLVPVATSLGATENRVLLARAEWAALGCMELARARLDDERAGSGVTAGVLDSVALGAGVWCRVEPLNADERVNPNVGDSIGLVRVFGDEVRAASVLDWIDADEEPREAGAERAWYRERGRPAPRNDRLRSVQEVRLVRGFEDVPAEPGLPDILDRMLTTRGDGRVSPSRAPAGALASISVLSPEDVARIVSSRRVGVPFATAEQMVSVAGIAPGIDEFRELTRRLSFSESETTVRVHGRVRAGARTLGYSAVAVLRRTPAAVTIASLEVE